MKEIDQVEVKTSPRLGEGALVGTLERLHDFWSGV